MNELLLSADEKELRDLHKAVGAGNHLVCRIENHSPDYKTKTWTYFFHITSSDGKVYYWPETFKDYQSARVFNDIKTAFGDSASIDHSANEGLKSFFEPARSNVIAFNFAARA
ncbi:hypothetical protein CW735_09850 [Alteromonas sp. MB-3u-76]|uniref:hypothetical protein n=1 Tax=Alteromonas sp. MB-3u-76 TaxID=2058133 RepID=UPI000C319717|nr:hypothetical protein [Alteromonas sp. MB-3u-76]AUC88448.1 hypothetical protein CW735_09850 [Alteromonas sp. MB-3u-76]